MADKITIELEPEIDAKLKERATQAGFDSLSTYVNYILRQVLESLESEQDEQQDDELDKVEKSKDMLRKLGYIE